MGRTNIDLNVELLTKTMKVTGKTTKKAAVEEAMRRTVRNAELKEVLLSLEGIGWEGDLDEMRESWSKADPA
jgi:Arc/MetJ family transcription regulator